MMPAFLRCQGKEFPDEVEHVLLEDGRESIDDLVQLIQTYKRKNKMVRVITSYLFKRRQEDLETALNRALGHLQVSVRCMLETLTKRQSCVRGLGSW